MGLLLIKILVPILEPKRKDFSVKIHKIKACLGHMQI